MSDLISRQAAIETEPEEDVKPVVHAHWIAKCNPVDALKPVTHAHWVMNKKSPYGYNCSNCGAQSSGQTNYCKDCGAKMDEEAG